MLLPLAGDVELHPGPSGVLAAIANALRDAHQLDPSPPPPASTPLRAVAHAFFLLAPMPRQRAPAQPDDAVSREPAPLPSPPASRSYGFKPTLAPPSDARDHLPQFTKHSLNANAAQMHEQLDGCLAALKALGDNPGTVKKDEAAWRRYWIPLTELL
eukprot:1026565-Pleurochrysis_carterae.AAC.1